MVPPPAPMEVTSAQGAAEDEAGHDRFGLDVDPAPGDEAHVEAGPAHVAGDDVLVAVHIAQVLPAEDAARRPRHGRIDHVGMRRGHQSPVGQGGLKPRLGARAS